MPHVEAFTAYPEVVPSARVRLASFAPFLAEHGVSLDFRPTLSDIEYARISSESGAVGKAATLVRAAARAASQRRRATSDDSLQLVHRLFFPVALPMLELTRQLDIYDFDDALFLGSTAASNRRYSWLKGEARRWRRYVREARVVFAGNSYLASEASRAGARSVEVIPSCVDPGAYEPKQHEPASPVVIGWIGSPSTVKYLEQVLPAVARMNRNGPRARLVIVGGSLANRPDWCEVRTWSAAREAEELSRFDIGVVPLDNSPWEAGKCGYKALLYQAAGLPVVGSPVGVLPEILGGERGQLATTSAEWEAALERFACSVGARQSAGEAGRQYVEAEFSYEVWAPRVAGLIKGL